MGIPVTLTAIGGNTYSWNNGQTVSSITVNPTATATYTVIGTDANGCTGVDSITVVITPSIIANAGPDGTICVGESTQLNASGGIGYSWIPSIGLSNSNVSNPIASPTSTTTYTVVITSGNCTPASDVVTIIVNPNPTVVAWSNTTITQGQSVTLTASGGGTYNWSNGSNGSSITVTPPVTTIYCVTVTDTNNCTDTACVTVTVIIESLNCSNAGELYLPNAFSPNGDGENDSLQIYYGNFLCIKSLSIAIYNRWGEKVFGADDMNFRWNGIYHGKKLDTGVFTYYLKAILKDGNEITRKGNVSIIR